MLLEQKNAVASKDEERGRVLSEAVHAAAKRLGLNGAELAAVLSVSEGTISRLKSGAYVLTDGSKEFEFAALLVRVFRSLDAIVGGDAAAVRAWMRAENQALGDVPAHAVRSITGLTDTLAYLDARRAPV